MKFNVPSEYYKNDTVYQMFGTDYGSNIFGCGFLNKTTPNCKESSVVYDHYGAVLILNGKGIYTDDAGNETKLYPGCLFQRIPGKCHSLYIEPDSQWLEFFICFGSELFKALASMNILNSKQNILYPGLSLPIFDKLCVFLSSMKSAHQSELNLLLAESLNILFILYELHSENTCGRETKEIIHQACILLSNNPSSRISAKDVSDTLGMGYEKFRKLFKYHIGISPGNYIIQKRMDVAKTLLIENTKSIKEVALELGFIDTFSFSKQFKIFVGMSPTEFRVLY